MSAASGDCLYLCWVQGAGSCAGTVSLPGWHVSCTGVGQLGTARALLLLPLPPSFLLSSWGMITMAGQLDAASTSLPALPLLYQLQTKCNWKLPSTDLVLHWLEVTFLLKSEGRGVGRSGSNAGTASSCLAPAQFLTT